MLSVLVMNTVEAFILPCPWNVIHAPRGWRLTDPIRTPRIAVSISVLPIIEDAVAQVPDAFMADIDADQDILTQEMERRN